MSEKNHLLWHLNSLFFFIVGAKDCFLIVGAKFNDNSIT